MRAMTDAYMKWAATQGEYGMESAPEPVNPDDIEKVYKVRAIDVFGELPQFLCHRLGFTHLPFKGHISSMRR